MKRLYTVLTSTIILFTTSENLTAQKASWDGIFGGKISVDKINISSGTTGNQGNNPQGNEASDYDYNAHKNAIDAFNHTIEAYYKAIDLWNEGKFYAAKGKAQWAIDIYPKYFLKNLSFYDPSNLWNLLGQFKDECEYMIQIQNEIDDKKKNWEQTLFTVKKITSWYPQYEKYNKIILDYVNDMVKEEKRDKLLAEGDIFFKQGKYEEAKTKYFDALQMLGQNFDNAAHYVYLYGYSDMMLGNYSGGKGMFERVIELEPNNENAYFYSGYCLHKQGYYKKSEQFYIKVTELNPTNSIAYNNLGYSYEKQGKYKEAERAFNTALKIDPSNQTTKGNLNEVLKKKADADKMQMQTEAAEIVFALDKAAAIVNPIKDLDPQKQELNCNSFFRALGQQFNATTTEWTDKKLSANQIADKITGNVMGDWEKIEGSEEKVTEYAQKYANQGIIVVGIIKGKNYGHIAIVSPIPSNIDPNSFGTKGPMVRDGNVHIVQGKKTPSGHGTVRASKVFDYKNAPPTWHVWIPSKK